MMLLVPFKTRKPFFSALNQRSRRSPNREPGTGCSVINSSLQLLWKRSYPNRGEKFVNVKNVESIFSSNFPFSSDFAFTLFHSGSS